MESEMENITTIKKTLELRISNQRDKLKACDVELKKKGQMFLDYKRVIKNIRNDIYCLNEHYQNPDKLKDKVKVSKYNITILVNKLLR